MLTKKHVSVRNESEAIFNINVKIAVLENLVKQEGDFNNPILKDFPVSLRQFNAWSSLGTLEIESKFSSNAAATLRKNSALTKQVLGLIRILRERKSKSGRSKKFGDLEFFKQQLKAEKSRCKVIEHEYVKSRLEVEKLEKQHVTLRMRLKNVESEAREQILERDNIITNLQLDNKDLISKLSKLTKFQR